MNEDQAITIMRSAARRFVAHLRSEDNKAEEAGGTRTGTILIEQIEEAERTLNQTRPLVAGMPAKPYKPHRNPFGMSDQQHFQCHDAGRYPL